MQESTWAILGVGIGLAGLTVTMIQNLRSELYEKLARFERHFDDKFARYECNFDEKLTRLENNFDERFERIEQKVDALCGKVARMDERLIEVEKHLFAVRTLLHYDVDIDKTNKTK
jgi:ribosome-associated translation inhibitor RaiA